ncbi:MAG: TetR/AcrR family transcriptional regulator [Candidatus Nealsonbacteria bacterium]|nr:TetR/AcrR family transcriptional regulator [Candidatus Nealsonbacteria bacterium]
MKSSEQAKAVSRSDLARRAFELFARDGFDGVSVEAVAAACGVTKGSLYWHYSSKKELVLAACSHYYRQWQEEAHGMCFQGDSDLDRFRNLVEMCVKQCLFNERNRSFTAELFAQALRDKDLLASWTQFVDTVELMLKRLFIAATQEQNVAVEHPEDRVRWMLSTIEGLKQMALCVPDVVRDWNVDKITERLVDEALHLSGSVRTA